MDGDLKTYSAEETIPNGAASNEIVQRVNFFNFVDSINNAGNALIDILNAVDPDQDFGPWLKTITELSSHTARSLDLLMKLPLAPRLIGEAGFHELKAGLASIFHTTDVLVSKKTFSSPKELYCRLKAQAARVVCFTDLCLSTHKLKTSQECDIGAVLEHRVKLFRKSDMEISIDQPSLELLKRLGKVRTHCNPCPDESAVIRTPYTPHLIAAINEVCCSNPYVLGAERVDISVRLDFSKQDRPFIVMTVTDTKGESGERYQKVSGTGLKSIERDGIDVKMKVDKYLDGSTSKVLAVPRKRGSQVDIENIKFYGNATLTMHIPLALDSIPVTLIPQIQEH